MGKRGAYNPRGKEKNFTIWQVRSLHGGEPIPGYVVVHFTFFMRIPASTPKKKIPLMLSGEIRPTNMDTTNCQKFYEDCIKNILIQDDRNVVKITSEKLYGDKGKILIRVWSLDEYESNSGVYR